MRRRERGATLVEYALLVGLLVLALTAAIQAFQDGSEAEFSERASAGTPSESFGNLGPTNGGSDDGGTDDGAEEPDPNIANIVVQPLQASAPAGGNRWSMTVTVRVLGDGNPLAGVRVSGSWSPNQGGGVGPCTTSNDGLCTFTQVGMSRTNDPIVSSAQFTLGTVTYSNADGTSPTISTSGSTISCTRPGTGGGFGACA